MAGQESLSLGKVMARHRGLTTGFDYLRLILGIAIILWHGILTTQGRDGHYWADWTRPIPAIILPMFFCLSGFLVAGSLVRTPSIKDFLLLRVIRIVPALMVEVFLCALILGPLLTTVSLADYFSGQSFYLYFLNIFGIVHYLLPGLFVSNPYPEIVNLNLRTLPAELYCYVMLALLSVCGVVRRRPLLLACAVAAVAVATVMMWPEAELRQGRPPTGYNMVIAFLFGVTMHAYRDRIPYHAGLFGVAVVMSLILLFKASMQHLAVPFIAYVTVYAGLWNPPKKGFLFTGDYSYGLYLYGFPMQQLYAYLFPGYLYWLPNVGFALTLGLFYAWLSWNLVEKPLLLQKNAIIARFNQILGFGRAPL